MAKAPWQLNSKHHTSNPPPLRPISSPAYSILWRGEKRSFPTCECNLGLNSHPQGPLGEEKRLGECDRTGYFSLKVCKKEQY